MLSRVQLFATPWTVAHQVPLSMEFSRQEYWSGLPFPSPRRERKSVEGGFRKKGTERAQRQRKKGEPAHEKNCLYLIPRSTGGRAARRGGDTGNRMEEWAGPGTVTPSRWCVDPKQVRFPGLQGIRSRVKKCLLRGGGGGRRECSTSGNLRSENQG